MGFSNIDQYYSLRRCSVATGRDAYSSEVFGICSTNDLPSPGHESCYCKRCEVLVIFMYTMMWGELTNTVSVCYLVT